MFSGQPRPASSRRRQLLPDLLLRGTFGMVVPEAVLAVPAAAGLRAWGRRTTGRCRYSAGAAGRAPVPAESSRWWPSGDGSGFAPLAITSIDGLMRLQLLRRLRIAHLLPLRLLPDESRSQLQNSAAHRAGSVKLWRFRQPQSESNRNWQRMWRTLLVSCAAGIPPSFSSSVVFSKELPLCFQIDIHCSFEACQNIRKLTSKKDQQSLRT